MSFTGVTDRALAAQLVAAALAQGKSLRQAIREYLEGLEKATKGRRDQVIAELVGMGFDAGLAARAFDACGDDAGRCAAWCAARRDAVIAELVGMGFDAGLAARAFDVNGDDVERCAAWCLAQRPPPPRASDADFALFGAPAPAPPPRPAPAPPLRPVAAAPPRPTPAAAPEAPWSDLPPALVAATNPYGHAPLRIISTPAAGVADGAAATADARNAAGRVQKAGPLAKLSTGGLLGQRAVRWQGRHFALGHRALAYGDAPADQGLWEAKKKFNIWGSYVVPEAADRAAGRAHAVAVYRGDEDVIAGPRSGADRRRSAAALSDRDATARDQILLVAADSEVDARRWTLALMAAAGRPGVGLLLSEDARTLTLHAVLAEPLGFAAATADHRLLVARVDRHGAAAAAGLRVGDELVQINGVNVQPADAPTLNKILGASAKPLDLRLRRRKDAGGAAAQRDAAQKALRAVASVVRDAAERQRASLVRCRPTLFLAKEVMVQILPRSISMKPRNDLQAA